MEVGIFYDLDPPAVIGGKIFRRVECIFQVPGHPDEYVVRGIPDGGTTQESFGLKFTQQGRIKPVRSSNQYGCSLRLAPR